MDLYLISVLVFVAVVALVVYKDKKNFRRESILLLRKTKRGKGFLIRIGTRFPRGLKIIGGIAVIVCFVVSVWIFYLLIVQTHLLATQEIKIGPGVLVPSLTQETVIGPGFFAVPFWYWIISIALLIIFHEGFHGIMAAREKIPLKSLGWGLLILIPLAFVEPDEKQLRKQKPWKQLRVFAAGSFANFILAGICFTLLVCMFTFMFLPIGVTYKGYPAVETHANQIVMINNYSVNNTEDLKNILKTLSANQTIEIITNESRIFLSTPGLLEKQLNISETLILWENYPAVRVNLTGMITGIDNYIIKDITDLRTALKETGPGKEITITTPNRTYVLTTVAEPEPEFKPGFYIHVLASLEQWLPGIIDISKQVSQIPSMLAGKEQEWRDIQLEIRFWEYISENYPGLSDRSTNKIHYLQGQLVKYPRPGFIGISNVITVMELKVGFRPYEGPINFLQGLLFFLFFINFMVGAFNLLPIGPLDGGRMWEIVFKKITPTYSKSIIKILTFITLFIIIIDFAMVLL